MRICGCLEINGFCNQGGKSIKILDLGIVYKISQTESKHIDRNSPVMKKNTFDLIIMVNGYFFRGSNSIFICACLLHKGQPLKERICFRFRYCLQNITNRK